MDKKLVVTGILLLAVGVTAMAMAPKNQVKFDEILATKYSGFQVNEIPDSSNVYLLISKDFAVILSKEETIFGGVKSKEILRVPLAK